MKYIGYVLLGILAAVALTFGGWAFKYYTAPIKGTVDAEVQIESGHNRIQNYERYFDMCSLAQTRQDSLEVQKSLLESAEDSKERSRIRSNIAGLEAQLARAVNQYNVDVQKEYTMARFKDASLPYELSTTQPIYCR